jgi:tripartite-type tricarboxylate transporter receptor subunit TctC
MGFAELVIGPATSGRTRWLYPSYRLRASAAAEWRARRIDREVPARRLGSPLAQDKSMRAIHKVLAVIVAAAMLFAGLTPAAAQSAAGYPNHPVVLIVPYGAGGVADVGMRLLGEKLSARLKQQFVIENKPGAAGIVAAQAGATAAPDGYTLLMTGNNNAIAASLFKKLPYNILTDFASVSTASFFDLLIMTRAGSPLKSLSDVVAYAKANPGKLNIGTTLPGSTQNLAATLFTSTVDIKATIVTFRTSPDMANAVMRGDVDIAFEFYAAIHGLLAADKVVALASTGDERTAYLPNVPTAIESGIKSYEVDSWNGLSVPAATPKPVVTTLHDAMKEVIPDPDLQRKSAQMGMAMRASTPDQMTARMKADIAKWGAVIDKAGIPKRD